MFVVHGRTGGVMGRYILNRVNIIGREGEERNMIKNPKKKSLE